MSNETKNWKLALYRLWWAEGSTWVDAVVLGAFVVALGIGLCIFVAAIAIFRGPPTESELVVLDGPVESFTHDGNAIVFQVSDRAGSFLYSDDEAALEAVAVAMSSGSAVQFSVLARDLPDTELNTRVWAIAVNGHVARTFAEVSTVWYENERDTLLNIPPIVLIITLLASAPFFATAYFERLWQAERLVQKR